MESYSFKNVDFTYPEGEKKALRNISFTIQQGEFVILCGPSGCGKSTLLRHLKSCLTPHGLFSGEIRYQGKLLSEMSQREQAQQIGYVLQSPENQVVTDKVWHELAFGLESLGYDTPTIRRRVSLTSPKKTSIKPSSIAYIGIWIPLSVAAGCPGRRLPSTSQPEMCWTIRSMAEMPM